VLVRKSPHCYVFAPVSVQTAFVMLKRCPCTSSANNVSNVITRTKYTVVFHDAFA